jgi:aspartate/methionine/tyrosine aminotransferase
MEAKLSRTAKKLTSSPIQELSHLAQRCNAINLAEGFPDFPAPLHIKNAAVSAINSDLNQYRFLPLSVVVGTISILMICFPPIEY